MFVLIILAYFILFSILILGGMSKIKEIGYPVVSTVLGAILFSVLFIMIAIIFRVIFLIALPVLIICMLFVFAGMLKMRKKHFAISTITGTIILAVLFTMSSVFWTKDIAYDTETIQHLEFGWPVAFYVQNQSRFDYPLPQVMGVKWEVADEPINKKNFYTSVAANFSGILLIWLLILLYLKRIDKNKIQNNLLK